VRRFFSAIGEGSMIRSFEGKTPRIGEEVFIADNAVVIGDVTIGASSSIWYGTIIRGDIHSITIGDGTNIQDLCVVHVTADAHDTRIGDQVTIGHRAIVHGCRIGSRVLVGMGAVVMDGVIVEEGSVIGAGALLPPGKHFPPHSLIVGSPAQVKRPISPEEHDWILSSSESYKALALRYSEEMRRVQPGR
jgi:gamma-carbonic anhydrase